MTIYLAYTIHVIYYYDMIFAGVAHILTEEGGVTDENVIKVSHLFLYKNIHLWNYILERFPFSFNPQMKSYHLFA